MTDLGIVVYGDWSEWLTISGYISFCLFITWCVLTRSSKP